MLELELEAKGDVAEGAKMDAFGAVEVEVEVEDEGEPKLNGLDGTAGGASAEPLVFGGGAATAAGWPNPVKTGGGAGIFAAAAGVEGIGVGVPNGDGEGALESAEVLVADFGRWSNCFCKSIR